MTRYFSYNNDNSSAPGRTVLVSGISTDVKLHLIKSLFSSFPGFEQWDFATEEISTSEKKVPKEGNFDESKMTVKATFDTIEHAQACSYRLRNKKWNDCQLNSKILGCENEEIQSELKLLVGKNRVSNVEKHRLKDSSKSGRIIVRNLHWRVDETRLRSLFSGSGEIQEVVIPTNADGSKRGFAFIQFKKKEHALEAVKKFQAHEIRGRPIAVDISVPKELHVKHNSGRQGPMLDEEDDGSSGEQKQSYEDESEEEDGKDEDEANSEQSEIDFESGTRHAEDESDNEEVVMSSDEENEGMDEEESSGDETDDGVARKKRKLNKKPSDVNEGKTVFVRNLPFRSTDKDLKELFSRFGEVQMAKVVVDKDTGESRGSGFVKFKETGSVTKCFEKLQSNNGLIMERRKLLAELAIPRDDVEKRSKEESRKTQLSTMVNDKRNLHLARVGLIRGDAITKMSKHDLTLRDKIEKLKKLKLKNSNIVVSQTRICVHNIPKYVSDKQLRKICLDSAGGTNNGAKITECRIMKAKSDKNESGLGKSLGFGFVTFNTHQHALKALNHLNDNPKVFTDQKRPIVEFSLENMLALQKKERRNLKTQMLASNSGFSGKKSRSRKPNENILNYKSKRKMKIVAKTMIAPKLNQLNESSTDDVLKPNNSATERNTAVAEFDLPEPVINTISVPDLKSLVQNPMPKKSALRSVDRNKLRTANRRAKLDKQRKLMANRNESNRSSDDEPKKQTKKTKSKKFMKEPLQDALDAIIEKHVEKRKI